MDRKTQIRREAFATLTTERDAALERLKQAEALAEALREIATTDSDGLETFTPQAMAHKARQALAAWEATNGRD